MYISDHIEQCPLKSIFRTTIMFQHWITDCYKDSGGILSGNSGKPELTQVSKHFTQLVLTHIHTLHYTRYTTFVTLHTLHYNCYTTFVTLHLLHYICYTTFVTLHTLHYICYTTHVTLHLLHYTRYTTFVTLH